MILLNRDDITHAIKQIINEKIWMEIQTYCRRVGKYCPWIEIEKINLPRYNQYYKIGEIMIDKQIDKVIIVYKDKENVIIKQSVIKLYTDMDYHEKVVTETKVKLNMI